MPILVTLLKDDVERHIHVEEEEDQGPVMHTISHKCCIDVRNGG